MKTLFSKIHADLYCGLSFFSRLPVQWLYRSDFSFSFARAIWTWPFVGLILGCIISLFYFVVSSFIPSPWIIAFSTLGFQLLLTGGLHEDGLADMADGFGGGKNKAHKLEIMRDSHLGSYGTLNLVIILGLQASSLAFLAQHHYQTMHILIVAAVLSRISMLIPIYFSQPARKDGLASMLGETISSPILIAVAVGLFLTFMLVQWKATILYIIISGLLSLGVMCIAKRQIQGYTGDILGATQVLVATGILIASTVFFILR